MIVVFLGPTLSVEAARRELDAAYLPPVAQGDVYRVALRRPRAIGIVDGYFQQVRSVWHKEILWAMREGVPVYGAASMGALRAAELADFGMVGVGRIFEDYYAERLEDDDEVAVLHGPPDTGYRALSEAMVNIRATLEKAAADAIITADEHATLLQHARATFYPDRTLTRLLDTVPLPADRITTLRADLQSRRVDQKALDALALLRRMAQDVQAAPPPRPAFHFEHTNLFEASVRQIGVVGAALDGTMLPTDRLVEELRLRGIPYLGMGERALLRESVARAARSAGMTPDARDVARCEHRFRAAHGLDDAEAFAGWLSSNDLSLDDFRALMHEEALLRWQRQSMDIGGLLRQLRLEDEYGDLRTRAEEKQRHLRGRGLDAATPADVGLDVPALLAWYFERARRPVPANVGEYARTFGFNGEDGFIDALAREYAFVMSAP